MKKVLIIEDNDTFLDNLSECLRMEGYYVITATDGREGVESAKAFIPDLIICDNRMPGLTGPEVLAELKATNETSSIPFIFSTSQSEKADSKKALEMGADDYFIKPYNIECIVDRIAELIQNASIKFKKNLQSSLSNKPPAASGNSWLLILHSLLTIAAEPVFV